jgi:hypothetical protein
MGIYLQNKAKYGLIPERYKGDIPVTKDGTSLLTPVTEGLTKSSLLIKYFQALFQNDALYPHVRTG